MLQALLPALSALGSGGSGLSGLFGMLGGGGETKVTQSVSQSTTAALLASINNTIGPGSSSSGAQTPTITQNPNAVATTGAAPSPAPVYGQTFGPDYASGDLASGAADTAAPVLAGFSPALALGAVVVFGAWFFFSGKNRGNK